MSALETNYASLDEDVCECGAVYRISEGHRCSPRLRLRVRNKISRSCGLFVVRPVQGVKERL